MPHCMALQIDYFLAAMTNALRLLLVSLVAVLVSAGLIGCATLSVKAGTSPAPPEVTTPAAMKAHGGHGMHATMSPARKAPLHDHESEDCDGCAQSVLTRASGSPDAGLVTSKLPAPVFVVPVALQLEAPPVAPVNAKWPPGLGPPRPPRTLTHQKVSLLI